MIRYAWVCQTCGERVLSDPKYWPVAKSYHDLLHHLEASICPRLEAVERAITKLAAGTDGEQVAAELLASPTGKVELIVVPEPS